MEKTCFRKWHTSCYVRILDAYHKRVKTKWQTCKDSNLNKVNQNHLCYRYTTGLRCAYNISPKNCFVKWILENFYKNFA